MSTLAAIVLPRVLISSRRIPCRSNLPGVSVSRYWPLLPLWKVYCYGEANSKARQLRLEVEDKKEHHTVTIELSLPSTYPNPSKWEKKLRDSISISLASPCYVDKAYKPNDQ